MLSLLRVTHVFAVALWFGSVAFFTVAGLLIFQSFRDVSALPADQRPPWLPLPEAFARESPDGFPNPLRLEQGSRAAGVAVGGIFPVYYATQAGCGVVALLTALLLARGDEGRGDGVRLALCGLALATVLGGWRLERRVTELRVPRNELTDQALASPSPAGLIDEAREARAEFGRWHGYSLIQNFVTLVLVAGVTFYIPSLSAVPPRGR
jgi:acyl phosphate:glycerol-3-phosphate acyltransferase